MNLLSPEFYAMDWWPVIKLIWGGIGFGFTCLILIVVWRARGVISWNHAIQKELKALAIQAETATPARKNGISLVLKKCDRIFHSLSPWEAADAKHLRDFVRSIAACFFPESEQPELQVSLGHLIRSLDASLSRFDRIIHRPGLNRLKSINIRTIRGLYRWSDELVQRPWVKWYVAHRYKIQRISLIRLFILPDPFSWILFLSRKLVILVLMKSLLVDVTLFVGKLALDSFDRENDSSVEENTEILEETLEDLSHIKMPPAMEHDPVIKEIRQGLVGFPAMLFSNPTWEDWKTAVSKAADNIARRHFPVADKPMEEAAIGPLLHRTRSWLKTLGKGDNVTIVRYIYKTRLETLFQARDITDLVLSPMVRSIVRTSFGAYGWIKWPLKIYRRTKRLSLPGIAVDLGWVLGKKSALAMIYGRTFDQACRELYWVYRISADMNALGGNEPSTGDSDVRIDKIQNGQR